MHQQFVYTKAPFPECHAATLVETTAGDILCAWFGGEYESHPSVGIWMSRLRNGQWSQPALVADEPDVPCWNPAFYRHSDGRIFLFYKAGETPKSWSGLYIVSEDDGQTWSEPTIMYAGLLGPIKNKPILTSTGRIISGSSVESYKTWACWVEISDDDGRTWKKSGPIGVPGTTGSVIQPTVWEVAPGKLRMLMRARKHVGAICMSISEDDGETWTPAQPIDLPNPDSGIDAVKTPAGIVALIYNHTSTARSPLNLAFSKDDGDTWSKPLTLEDQPGEYSYPAIICDRSGNLHMAYTWKRERIRYAFMPAEEIEKALEGLRGR